MLQSTTRTLSLAELAERHACDKGYRGASNRWVGTNYAAIYQAYLEPRRGEPLSLLEIGLGVQGPNWQADVVHGRNMTGGASMKMWEDYLPNATITGVDINPASFLNTGAVTTYEVDQGSRDSWRHFLGAHPDPSFDIVIDDGSHRGDHQQVSLEMLWPHLKPGGAFFIEDLSDYGAGERPGGRFGSPMVATRRLLKHYARTGELLEPHAFENPDFLSDVESILFYCPRALLRPRDLAIEAIRLLTGRHHRGIIRPEWATDSEMLVALHRRA